VIAAGNQELLMDQPEAPPQPTRSALPFTVIAAVVHGALTIFLVVGLFVWVPIYERLFMDFRMKLPTATVGVIEVSRWLREYWYFLMPLVALLLALDGLVLFLLRRQSSTRGVGLYWFLFVTLLLVLVGGIVAVAIWLPYAKLTEALQK
jgi:hypothetical protein